MPRVRLATFVAAGLILALALAFFVAPRAANKPDGLTKVAADQGVSGPAHDRADGSPLAGYRVTGVKDDRLATSVAGVIGVAVTFAAVGGGLLLARRVQRRRSGAAAAPPEAGP